MMMEMLRDPELAVAVAFVIAVGLMWWKGAGAIGAMLDARAAKISFDLDEARRLRDEAVAALEEFRRRQDEAAATAKDIAQRAKAEADRLAAQAAVDLEASIQRREALARDRIKQAEIAAIAEVRAVAVEVAIAAATRIIADSLDPARGAALIDQSIANLPASLH
jgi:F-type H+-transporting ATPase subunit b